jgi:hypothetical protein
MWSALPGRTLDLQVEGVPTAFLRKQEVGAPFFLHVQDAL